MNKAVFSLVIALIALTGCTRHYVMKLNNGSQITTATKPKLKEDVYCFKDAKGEEQKIAASRVREIEPASTAAQESKPKPIKSDRQTKRKWYLLWLA
jgi:hypothetical protein